jgi:hypothetical protein
MIVSCGRRRTGRFVRLPVTCKETLELIIFLAGRVGADIYQVWDRSVLVPASGSSRWLQTSDTMSSLTSSNDSLLNDIPVSSCKVAIGGTHGNFVSILRTLF